MKFALIDQAKEQFPVQRLCGVLGVNASGYFAWKDRPACRRQRDDLALLAHARSSFTLSNGTYGSPRMTRELQDNGFAVIVQLEVWKFGFGIVSHSGIPT